MDFQHPEAPVALLQRNSTLFLESCTFIRNNVLVAPFAGAIDLSTEIRTPPSQLAVTDPDLTAGNTLPFVSYTSPTKGIVYASPALEVRPSNMITVATFRNLLPWSVPSAGGCAMALLLLASSHMWRRACVHEGRNARCSLPCMHPMHALLAAAERCTLCRCTTGRQKK